MRLLVKETTMSYAQVWVTIFLSFIVLITIAGNFGDHQ